MIVLSWSGVLLRQITPVTVLSAPVGVHFVLRLRFKVVFFWLIDTGAGSLKLSVLEMLRASLVQVLLSALTERILLGVFVATREVLNVREVLPRSNACFTLEFLILSDFIFGLFLMFIIVLFSLSLVYDCFRERCRKVVTSSSRDDFSCKFFLFNSWLIT